MNLATETAIIGGQTVKKKLIIALVGGFLFLGALLGTFGLTGMAAAMPLVGGFTVSFDEMQGTGFKLYGSLADSAMQQNNPVAVNEIDKATITNLKISKSIPFLKINAVITAEKPVEITGLQQKATMVRGDASFNNLTMAEKYVGDRDLSKPEVLAGAAAEHFTQTANSITIKNGVLDTVYLFQKTVTLGGMKVLFEPIQQPSK
ncbi:hypothetical protein BABA_11941 [Neobacillus bataviensis LMG 21833]|uniref:Uncharacterized protein n=1 Tax=Neobacillus bataviensis LMG 21833 TaxID=1117379 RepID=K6DKT4_9BACI|nr:DUF6230 family protein [Neobacillus bataviensis]EKN68763.1 hypothetical protein BABA_11941 [Neobacillus bataviensis LMG 21833]